jgi:hypothetical protein
MVVARPLGTSIPVGSVSEQNPALIANWVSASLAEAFVFLDRSVKRLALLGGTAEAAVPMWFSFFSYGSSERWFIKETE